MTLERRVAAFPLVFQWANPAEEIKASYRCAGPEFFGCQSSRSCWWTAVGLIFWCIRTSSGSRTCEIMHHDLHFLDVLHHLDYLDWFHNENNLQSPKSNDVKIPKEEMPKEKILGSKKNWRKFLKENHQFANPNFEETWEDPTLFPCSQTAFRGSNTWAPWLSDWRPSARLRRTFARRWHSGCRCRWTLGGFFEKGYS